MRTLSLLLMAFVPLLFYNCKRYTDSQLPPSVPAGSSFDRKRGLYTHRSPAGEVRQYYKNGKVYREGRTEGGKKSGHWKSYSMLSGRVTAEGDYKEGIRDGVWRFYDTSGRLYQTTTFAASPVTALLLMETGGDYGSENGLYMRYYSDGTLEETGHFRAGILEGEIKRYYPSGRLHFTGRYREDKKDGEWLYYHPNAAEHKRESWSSGKPNGRYESHHRNRMIYVITSYKNGDETGPREVLPP